MSLMIPADLSGLIKAGDWQSKLKALKWIQEKKLNLPEEVLTLGTSLLKTNGWQLGENYWEVCEQVFYASLDCQASEWLKFTILSLKNKFGETQKITRLEGIYFEYMGKFTDAEKVYESLLEKNPLDKMTWKRKVCMLRTVGYIDQAINEMNRYLEVFQDDLEAWEELCDIYMSMQHYSQAAYCYEEVVLAFPDNFWVILKYGEILYSIGGPEKMVLARKYFVETLILNPKCLRGKWLLLQCCNAINQVKPDQTNTKLKEKALNLIYKAYEKSKFDIKQILA